MVFSYIKYRLSQSGNSLYELLDIPKESTEQVSTYLNNKGLSVPAYDWVSISSKDVLTREITSENT